MDPDKIALWISVGLSVLLLIERGSTIYRTWKKGKREDETDDMDLAKRLREMANDALQREQAWQEKFRALEVEHNEMKATLRGVGYEISFVLVLYPPSVSRFKVKKVPVPDDTQPVA